MHMQKKSNYNINCDTVFDNNNYKINDKIIKTLPTDHYDKMCRSL